MSEATEERRERLRCTLALAVVNVAERHPKLRWPCTFDETELQKMAVVARRYLRSILSQPNEGEGE